MKTLRDVLLIVLGIFVSVLFPAISEVMYPSTQKNLGRAWPIVVTAIILVIAAGIGLFYLVKKIDDNEQKKDDEKLKKMVKEVVKEVMEEIRNGKTETNNKPQH